MTDPISTYSFDSTGLPAPLQFAAFASHTRNSRVTRPGPADAPFDLKARFWTLDGLTVSEQHADPFNFDRDQAMIRATGTDHYLVVAVVKGETRFTSDDGTVVCGPDGVLITDLNRPAATQSVRQHSIAVNIARDFLHEATGPIDAHGLLPDAPETRLLFDFLRTLVGQLPAAAPASVGMLSRIVRDLLANALGGFPHPAGTAAPSRLRSRARAYAAAQPPGTLDVGRMATELGIARSTLFRLFRPDGGVMAYDRARRLRALHRNLADPLDRRSIGEIGFAHGFEDAAHLANLFRARFGYSMRELRGQLGRGEELPGTAADVPLLYRDAVSALS